MWQDHLLPEAALGVGGERDLATVATDHRPRHRKPEARAAGFSAARALQPIERERLDAFEDMAEVGITVLRDIISPFMALYAVLSEEQRARAGSLINHHRHGQKMHL